MSSSAEPPPSWADFEERPACGVELRSPAAELAAVLQRYRSELDAAARAGAQSRAQGLSALAEQAVLVIELEKLLARHAAQLADPPLDRVHRALRILKDRMLEQIEASGLQVVRLAGEPASAVIDLVEVECWRHGDAYSSEVVSEELEVAVLLDGVVLRHGRVVMGAPREAQPASAPPPADELPEPDETTRRSEHPDER